MKKRKCLLMMMVLAWSAGTIFGQQKGESAFRSLHSRYRILPENIGFAILNADRAGYGDYIETYKNGNDYYPIKTYVHTHPHTGCNGYNSLCISAEDIENAKRFNGEINILLLDGSFYRQSTESSESIYVPNCRGNIYNDTFSY